MRGSRGEPEEMRVNVWEAKRIEEKEWEGGKVGVEKEREREEEGMIETQRRAIFSRTAILTGSRVNPFTPLPVESTIMVALP